MSRTLAELVQAYSEQRNKILRGEEHLKNLFAIGTKVKDPLNGNKEITFNSAREENDFFLKLTATGEYPFAEIARTKCTEDHMKLFLLSKGFSPEDIAELIMDPESEKSRVMADRIRDIRQEYYDQVINKDMEKISGMYVNAFRNLSGLNMDWLREAGTPDGYIEKMPMLNALTGVQSYWEQTNNLAGTNFRPIDRKVMTAVIDRMDAEGIKYAEIIDSLKFMQLSDQAIRNKFDNLPENNDLDSVDPAALSSMALMIRCFATTPAGATLEEIGVMDPEKSRYARSLSHNNYYVSTDGPLGDTFRNKEYMQNIKAWMLGEEGAVGPVQIFDTKDEMILSRRQNWGIRSGGPAESAKGYDVRRPEWKTAMEEGFRKGELMDPGSVLHCINLAKEGKYDAVSGMEGDGAGMLQVMNGDMAGYDSLSDLSKAAAAGFLVMEHPELFIGSAKQMQRSAESLGLDLDNPVYAAAMEGALKLSDPEMAEKTTELKEAFAQKKLEAVLESAPAEDKKNLARTLFLMQLGNTERVADADQEARRAEMLAVLAAGEKVRFLLPGRDKEEGAPIRTDILKDGLQVAEGMKQSVLYENDHILSVRLGGGTGYAAAPDGQLDVDLRGIDRERLDAMLTGLDEKTASMAPEELDGLIGKLKGGSLERTEMSELVGSFGLDAMGNEKQNKAQMELAAKEIAPKPVLGLNDLTLIDSAYRKPLDGERKYNAPAAPPTEEFEKALEKDEIPEQKAFFNKYLELFKDQTRLMQMYADGAERMHRIRAANENSTEPLNNVRVFAQRKEKELAEKYRAARDTVMRMTEGIRSYRFKDGERKNYNEVSATRAWISEYISKPDVSRKVSKDVKKGPTAEEFEASMASDFTAVDFEKLTFREQQNLTDHKWTLLGIRYDNSDKYQDILDSMEALKKMRSRKATAENIMAYQKECEYLRDLCEDYVVSRRNPWATDGKERRRMVTDVWEGISNVTGQTFKKALASADPEKTISSLNIHAGYRRSISLEELKAREPERTARLAAEKARRKETAERAPHHGDSYGIHR